jgi:hypothetical protein
MHNCNDLQLNIRFFFFFFFKWVCARERRKKITYTTRPFTHKIASFGPSKLQYTLHDKDKSVTQPKQKHIVIVERERERNVKGSEITMYSIHFLSVMQKKQ